MKSRDKALEVVRANMKDQEDERIKIKGQIYRYTELFKRENDTRVELCYQLEEIKMKQKYIHRTLDKNKKIWDKLENKRNLLNTAANETKENIRKQENADINLRMEIEFIDKK